MKTKTMMLCTIALTLGGCSTYNMSNSSGPRYTPRPEIAQSNYTHQNHVEDHMDGESYDKYEQREPCQQYRKIPRNYVEGCIEDVTEEEVITYNAVTTTTTQQKTVLPIVSTYTILFDYDKSNIRGNEQATLDRIAQEISKYNPKQVTVTGYTDSAGKADYNQTLSRQREQTVSAALLKRGIENRVLDREARGEYQQAVKTADGVKLQENRRVVIDFRR